MIDNARQHYAKHELVWISAATTLAGKQRAAAYVQIAEMAGRDYRSIRIKANKILRGQVPKADMALLGHCRAEMQGLAPAYHRIEIELKQSSDVY